MSDKHRPVRNFVFVILARKQEIVMDILEQMMLEYAAMKSEQEVIAAEREAIEAERLYLTKMIELIERVIAAKDLGLSFEALEKAEMFLSEQAYQMELETDRENTEKLSVGNEKLYADDMLLEDVSLYPQLRKEA